MLNPFAHNDDDGKDREDPWEGSPELPLITDSTELERTMIELERAHGGFSANVRVSEAQYQAGDWFLRHGERKVARVAEDAVVGLKNCYLFCRAFRLNA